MQENDREYVLEQVKQTGSYLDKVSEEFKDDKEIVLAAIEQDGNALEFASSRLKADKEIVMIAAWLHDIASITDYSLYELHHIHGAQMAYSILKEYNYDDKKITLVQKCIQNHRGSVNLGKSTLEELCVADADAISHVDNIPSLLYLAYVQKGMGIEEGQRFVRDKLIRSFQKLSIQSKKYYQNKFEKAIEVLNGES